MPRINAATIGEHKELTRSALLEAGADSFVKLGLGGTSIGSLADEAGIARTTVYEYFPNKEAVLAALIYDRLPPVTEAVLAGLPDGNVIARIAEIMRRSLVFVHQYPVETALLFKVSRELSKPERDAVWTTVRPIRDEVVELCRELVASDQLAGVDPISLGGTVGDLIIGGIDEISGRGPEHADAVIAARVGFLRRGLGAAG